MDGLLIATHSDHLRPTLRKLLDQFKSHASIGPCGAKCAIVNWVEACVIAAAEPDAISSPYQ